VGAAHAVSFRVTAFLERAPPSQLFKSWQGPAQLQRRELCSTAIAARSLYFTKWPGHFEAIPLTFRQKIGGRRSSVASLKTSTFYGYFQLNCLMREARAGQDTLDRAKRTIAIGQATLRGAA
jgi:hypothetical protein